MQLVEQRARRAQIAAVEPLCEATVGGGEHRAGRGVPALPLPQPAQAEHRTQLQRPRALPAGDPDRVVKAPLRPSSTVDGVVTRAARGRRAPWLAQEQLAAEPV
ncbi:MAG: hypothetical protein AB1689_08645, partial [Thermodesulfobacteriota bacterium]